MSVNDRFRLVRWTMTEFSSSASVCFRRFVEEKRLEPMSQLEFLSREDGGRNRSDPSSSTRNFSNAKYHRRGATRPNDFGPITVSIQRNLSSGSTQRTFLNRPRGGRSFQPRPIHTTHEHPNEEKWWRVSIPQAGSIGKERVMSTLKVHCLRQFQPYHVGE